MVVWDGFKVVWDVVWDGFKVTSGSVRNYMVLG